MLIVKLYNPVKLDPGKGVLKGNLDSTSSLNHQVLFILTCRSLQNSRWHVHSFLSTEITRQDNQVCYHKPLKRNTHMHTFFLGCGMAVFCFSHKLYKDRKILTNLSSVLHWRLKKKKREKKTPHAQMDGDFLHVLHSVLSPQDHLQPCTVQIGVLKNTWVSCLPKDYVLEIRDN